MTYAHVLLVIRLDSIAIDAELQEKSEADLKQLAEVLQKHVDESMAEYAQKLQEDPSFDGECSAYKTFISHLVFLAVCRVTGGWYLQRDVLVSVMLWIDEKSRY